MARAVAFVFGLTLALLTFAALFALYPPQRGDGWTIVAIATLALAFVTGLNATLTRLGFSDLSRWLVFGYAVGLAIVGIAVSGAESSTACGGSCGSTGVGTGTAVR